MTKAEANIGTRVRTLMDFAGVPKGTEGVIDQDYKHGVMVAWDLPGRPLPAGYSKYSAAYVTNRIIRDGFDKDTELHYLELVVRQAHHPEEDRRVNGRKIEE
jgi:hypothetical protein